jgi:adenosylcobinamide-phosphate synthase
MLNIYIWIILIVFAIIIDWIVGDPPGLPHPIVFIGKYIDFLYKRLNKGNNKTEKGFLLFFLVVLTVGLVTVMLQFISFMIHPYLYYIVNLYLLYTTLAATCLTKEVKKVSKSLAEKNINEARKLMNYLVGRDTMELGEEEIVRAAVETTAENIIDGVIAPLFYMGIGLFVFNPVLMALLYKSINTMDSMIGYIQEPYKEIGYAAAKIDDLVNMPVARFGSLFIILSGIPLRLNVKNGWKIFLRDRENHKSPNSAHPESAVAGLLEIQLGGINTYFGEVLEKPTIGDRIIELSYKHIDKTCRIIYVSEGIFAVIWLGLIAGLMLII